MRACEADRCDLPATVVGRWCERHAPADKRVHRLVEIQHDANGDPFIKAQMTRADVAPEYAPEAPSTPAGVWLRAESMVDEAEHALKRAREGRLAVLQAWRDQGMSLGDIAEVTGLTRQRIGQLLKG